jgi:L-threonylcarbamoyladenylate synthase
MNTRHLSTTPEDIAEAAKILRAGGTVAFPTETVYGLGANALNPTAVEKIFQAKQRPAWDPLIVHVGSPAMLHQVAKVTPEAERLIAAFWPGPLTLLLGRTAEVPDSVTAGRSLVGVRMPAHPVAHALITVAGIPIAAPSANLFGHISPTTAQHVLEDLDLRIDAVLDGGPTEVGVESTVLDPAARIIYRPGAVTPAMLDPILGPVTIYQPPIEDQQPDQQRTAPAPRSLQSPGIGIRHYAPYARLVLVANEAELNTRLIELQSSQQLIGVMLPQDWTLTAPAEVFLWSAFTNPGGLAQTLFAGLRELDHRGVTLILCPLPNSDGLGLAIRDRLEKAAKPK